MHSIELEKEKTLALRALVEKRNALFEINKTHKHQVTNKWPEDQTEFTKRIYKLHQPIFLFLISLSIFYLLKLYVLPFLGNQQSLGFLKHIEIIPAYLQSIYTLYFYIIIGLPTLLSIYEYKRMKKYKIKEYHTELIGFTVLILYFIFIAYIILMITSVLGIPLVNFIFQSELNAFNLINNAMKYILIHSFLHIVFVYFLMYPFMIILKVMPFIHPLFILPFLVSKFNMKKLILQLNESSLSLDGLENEIKQYDILDDSDKNIQTLDAILMYFSEKRIDTAQLGAIVYKNERDFKKQADNQYAAAKIEATSKISEIRKAVDQGQKALDRDLDQKVRKLYNAQKSIDDIEQMVKK